MIFIFLNDIRNKILKTHFTYKLIGILKLEVNGQLERITLNCGTLKRKISQ